MQTLYILGVLALLGALGVAGYFGYEKLFGDHKITNCKECTAWSKDAVCQTLVEGSKTTYKGCHIPATALVTNTKK